MRQPRWVYGILGAVLVFSAVAVAWALYGGRETILLRGSFHSVAHKGSGEARVVTAGRGGRVLRLLDLKTYPGEDLEVCLVGAPDAEDNDTVRDSQPVCLGAYQARTAYESYAVPATVDLERYRAVAIWSRSLRVNFTTAPLAP